MIEPFKRLFKDRLLMLNVCGLVLFPMPLTLMVSMDYLQFLSQNLPEVGVSTDVYLGFQLQDVVRRLGQCGELAFGIGGVGLLMVVVTWSLMVHRDYLARRASNSVARPPRS